MRARLLLAAAVTLLAPPARAADGVVPGAELHLWTVLQDGLPGTDVRYDPAAQAFDAAGYLQPQGGQGHPSALVTLSLDGRHLHGDLRWRVALDTGTLQRRGFPVEGAACWSRATNTGLANVGQGECSLFLTRNGTYRPMILPVQEEADGPEEWISNGRPLEDEAQATAFVREAWVAWSVGRAGFLTLTGGRFRQAVGDGYLHDDLVTGLRATADVGAIGPPLEVSLAVFSPERDWPLEGGPLSPMAVARVDFLPSLFERAGLFAAGLLDRSGGSAELLRTALVERQAAVAGSPASTPLQRQWAQRSLAFTQAAPLGGEATLWWLGTSGRLLPGKGHRLSWTAALARGQLDTIESSWVAAGPLVSDLTIHGTLVSARWEWALRQVRTSASFLYASGGELPRSQPATSPDDPPPPMTGTYRGFLGVSPLLTETSIFFRGGLSEQLGARLATAPGVNGRGVIAPVLGLGWDPAETFSLDLRGAWLQADADGPYGGRGYGTELDLVARWEPLTWLRVGAEADVLFPGDFYPSNQPVQQAILALDVVTP
ncbi:MAG: hypothetical protein QM767_21860 [Anaeromyxobacter sp.]